MYRVTSPNGSLPIYVPPQHQIPRLTDWPGLLRTMAEASVMVSFFAGIVMWLDLLSV